MFVLLDKDLKSLTFVWYLLNTIRTMGKNIHIVKHSNGWAVRGAGNQKVTKVTDTQFEAISRGKEIAKNNQSELVIHGKNGRIREKNSYGEDSCPPKG